MIPSCQCGRQSHARKREVLSPNSKPYEMSHTFFEVTIPGCFCSAVSQARPRDSIEDWMHWVTGCIGNL